MYTAWICWTKEWFTSGWHWVGWRVDRAGQWHYSECCTLSNLSIVYFWNFWQYFWIAVDLGNWNQGKQNLYLFGNRSVCTYALDLSYNPNRYVKSSVFPHRVKTTHKALLNKCKPNIWPMASMYRKQTKIVPSFLGSSLIRCLG